MLRRLAPLLLLLLVACQPQPAPQLPEQTPRAWPVFDFEQAMLAGERVLRLLPEMSHIDVVVRRAGALARFGHDHVIVADAPEGWILWPDKPGSGRAEMRIRVDSLTVDPMEARLRHNLDTEPDAVAVAGTRSNMLDKVLESSRWADILLTVTEPRLTGARASAMLEFTIKGVSYTERAGFEISRNRQAITVSGQLSLRQSDFGIEPFSALGGGLQVADILEIHFRLTAAGYGVETGDKPEQATNEEIK